jgi:hypothetical protein
MTEHAPRAEEHALEQLRAQEETRDSEYERDLEKRRYADLRIESQEFVTGLKRRRYREGGF